MASEVLAALISAVPIWAIFSAIFLAICLAAAVPDVQITAHREGRTSGLVVHITFEEAVFGCEKELELTSEGNMRLPAAVTERSQGLHRRPVRSATEKAR